MDIDALKTFIEVHRTRHFGQAAENLFLSQSAVSARIRMLEDEVGVPLFTRKRNNIELTAAGQKLLGYAENIIVTWRRARQEIGGSHPSQIPLVIGCMPSLWDILLQDLIARLRNKHPEVIIHTEIHSQETLLRRVKEGTMDLAFCFEYPHEPALETTEVITIPMILVSSRSGLTAEQAMAGGYILVDWGSSFATAHARHFPNINAPSTRLALGRMAKDLLLLQGGSAYLAETMVTDELANGILFKVQDAPQITRRAYAAYAPESEKAPLLRQTLALAGVDTVQPVVEPAAVE